MNLKKLQNASNTSLGRILNLIMLFKGYAPVPPIFIELLLTYRCNLSCDFCYQAKEKRKVFSDMSLDDARRIEENLRVWPFLKPRIHLFGGEPGINKDFVEILKYFSDKGYPLSITTNGAAIEKYSNELLHTPALVEINLSLNSLEFDKYFSILKRLADKKKFKVTLNCPINAQSQHILIDIIKKFEHTCVDLISFQHTTFTDNYQVPMDPRVIKEQVLQIKRSQYRMPVAFLPDIKNRDIEGFYNDPDFPRGINKCVFCWFVLFIQPNGDVIPCDELDHRIGNVKEESLSQVWNNAKFRNFRESIRKKGVSYPICKRCCHRQYY